MWGGGTCQNSPGTVLWAVLGRTGISNSRRSPIRRDEAAEAALDEVPAAGAVEVASPTCVVAGAGIGVQLRPFRKSIAWRVEVSNGSPIG